SSSKSHACGRLLATKREAQLTRAVTARSVLAAKTKRRRARLFDRPRTSRRFQSRRHETENSLIDVCRPFLTRQSLPCSRSRARAAHAKSARRAPEPDARSAAGRRRTRALAPGAESARRAARTRGRAARRPNPWSDCYTESAPAPKLIARLFGRCP